MRPLLLSSIVIAASAAPAVARADAKQVCNAAYEQAQVLRNDHKLVEAREQLKTCAAPSCPGFIVKDCTDWLKDVETRMPSVVVSAKNAAGADATDARVSIDGAPLAGGMNGLAVDVDPGPHTFTFEGADGRAEQRVIVAEGAKAQRVAVVLGAPGAGAGTTAAPAVVTASPGADMSATTVFSEPAENGLSFGFRIGYGVAAGSVDATAADSLSDYVTGQVPLWFDAGYLFNPYFYAGAYLSYGIGSAASNSATGCVGTVSCSASDLRVGVDIQIRPLGRSRLQPWVGLGFLGYEGGTLSGSSGGASASINVSGIEWLNPQAGFDYKLLPTLSAGAFVSFSLSQFLGRSASLDGMPLNDPLGDKALHEWIMFGVRSTFDLHI